MRNKSNERITTTIYITKKLKDRYEKYFENNPKEKKAKIFNLLVRRFLYNPRREVSRILNKKEIIENSEKFSITTNLIKEEYDKFKSLAISHKIKYSTIFSVLLESYLNNYDEEM